MHTYNIQGYKFAPDGGEPIAVGQPQEFTGTTAGEACHKWTDAHPSWRNDGIDYVLAERVS